MTIAVVVKVNSGIVLASDSATTILSSRHTGVAEQIYNNTNKIYNLHIGLPVGAITWGLGSIGNLSMEMICKNFRNRNDIDWECYNMDTVANGLISHISPLIRTNPLPAVIENPEIGFYVAGYSKNEDHEILDLPEVWYISFKNNINNKECKLNREDVDILAMGQPDAIYRLKYGFNPSTLKTLLQELRYDNSAIENIIEQFIMRSSVPLLAPSMPIQDAIDLAIFLVEMTIGYVRYIPGALTVAGQVEVATITKHEGFKWVRRKHYYNTELNPEKRY